VASEEYMLWFRGNTCIGSGAVQTVAPGKYRQSLRNYKQWLSSNIESGFGAIHLVAPEQYW
jgi:hypothetical protein